MEKRRYYKLPGDKKVANGNWYVNNAQAKFNWNYRHNCNPNIGARLEISQIKVTD